MLARMVTERLARQRGQRRGDEILSAAVSRSARRSHNDWYKPGRSLARELGWSQSFVSLDRNEGWPHDQPDRHQPLSRPCSASSRPLRSTGRAGDCATKGTRHSLAACCASSRRRGTWRVKFPSRTRATRAGGTCCLRLPNFRLGVEAETRIRDMQALVRRMRERAQTGGADALLLVLSDSGHNRELGRGPSNAPSVTSSAAVRGTSCPTCEAGRRYKAQA